MSILSIFQKNLHLSKEDHKMIKQLSVLGFRGFGERQTVDFAIPDGNTPGSGLSIITGANNSGKTTIVEAIQAFNCKEAPSISEGRRNALSNGRVELTLEDVKGEKHSITSTPAGGSITEKDFEGHFRFYILQSRRAVPFEFREQRYGQGRDEYIDYALNFQKQRTPSLNQFEDRLFDIIAKKNQFDEVLQKVLGFEFLWTLELRDNGQYYIKYSFGDVSHSSEGIGDGIWSIFTICAALFDSEAEAVIIIDEPELSIHPTLQKKLKQLLLEYSATRQIIICTHSPYFVDWNVIAKGAKLIRVIKDGPNSKCFSIGDKGQKIIAKMLNDLNNPHVLGIDASEVFFLEDNIILVEGQEDVVIFNKIADSLELPFRGTFFGWGAGGAAKIKMFLTLFQELGFKKVVAIFDGDMKGNAENVRELFPKYHIEVLEEDDIRDKKQRKINSKTGITDENGDLKEQYRSYARKLIESINSYLA